MWIRILGGRKGYKQTLKALAYGFTPFGIFGWIPFIGFLASLWSFLLNIIGISRLQNINYIKSLTAFLISISLPLIIVELIFSFILNVSFIFSIYFYWINLFEPIQKPIISAFLVLPSEDELLNKFNFSKNVIKEGIFKLLENKTAENLEEKLVEEATLLIYKMGKADVAFYAFRFKKPEYAKKYYNKMSSNLPFLKENLEYKKSEINGCILQIYESNEIFASTMCRYMNLVYGINVKGKTKNFIKIFNVENSTNAIKSLTDIIKEKVKFVARLEA